MSADVQPRRRKDKKKKRDSVDSKSEGEIIARKLSLKDDEDTRESHHGVHATKMGIDDVHLHIQGEHSTGGHWCAKIFFFSLLAILLGLIGLIIVENRGLSDLDTPLSESRFSEYFEGWVDEHRQAHEEHEEKIPAELEDHDAEPFEEEEDHSEVEDDEEHDGHDEHEENVDVADKEDEDQGIEEDYAEETTEDLRNEDIMNNEDDEENEEQADVEENETEDDDDDDDEVEENEKYSSNINAYLRAKREIQEDDDDIDEGFGENEIDDDVNNNSNDDDTHPTRNEQVPQESINSNQIYEQDPYEEDDDDFESLETVVYNDAAEDLHLQQKAKQEQVHTPIAEQQEEQEPESSSEIKSKPAGGPQSYSEDDFIEEQLRRANEEMLQNNIQSALKIFETLSLKYPDIPGALYGKAKALDRLSEQYKSNQILVESIMAYKRFLALEDKIENELFKEGAERCIDRMRFRGLNLQAVPIHEKLIKRFPNEPYYRNQLAVTYLLVNRSKENSTRNLTAVAR